MPIRTPSPTGRKFPGEHGDPGGHLDLLLFGTAASVVFALVAQIGEQVDFLRFLPRDRRTSRTSWWIALLSAGPGWIVLGALKLLAGSFLAFFALSHGVSLEHAAEPAHMYLEAFRYVLSQPELALALTGSFVILSQLKINVTNAYAGSIAWSNFFSRLTHSHPGRVVWLVFNVLVALLLMEIGVYKALEQTLALYSNVAIAWVGALVADLVINKPLGLRPQQMEFKRAHLYDINPVGVGAMSIATIVSISAFYGLFGPTAKALAPFVALIVAFVTAPLIAFATGGKYYIARKPKRSWQNLQAIQCCICEHTFEPEDMASCPAYAGPICSLCCSLDARCHDLCKPHARIQAQVADTLGKLLPKPIYARINSQLGHYLGVFAVSAGLVGLTLGMIYLQTSATIRVDNLQLSDVLWKVFFALTIIIGVVAWLFVLAQQSRRAAEAETRRQTALLIQEIDAHKRTDAELQRAKEVAESANLAKSRYVVGLSHELRSPLNAISGYAQLLEQDSSLLPKPRDQVRVVRRSADHLSGLIDGILDISKIEAGRLYLSRDEVRLSEFLDQLVGMFRLQAAAKGIEFDFRRPPVLPFVVYADEKRLRQILINLLSNAIKFTQRGSVLFAVHYRSPVAEFEVTDTGPGIQAERPRAHLCAVRARRARRLAAADRNRARPDHQPAARGRDGRRHPGLQRGRRRQHLPRQDPAVGGHQSDPDRARQRPRVRLSRPAQDHPDHRRRSDAARPVARGADAARLHPAQRPGRRRLPRAGAALPARSVPARHLDVRHGWMDRGRDAAFDRPPSGPHPDGFGQRAGGPWRPAGAAVSRRLPDEADRYSAAAGIDPPAPQARMAI